MGNNPGDSIVKPLEPQFSKTLLAKWKQELVADLTRQVVSDPWGVVPIWIVTDHEDLPAAVLLADRLYGREPTTPLPMITYCRKLVPSFFGFEKVGIFKMQRGSRAACNTFAAVQTPAVLYRLRAPGMLADVDIKRADVRTNSALNT